MNYQMTLIVEDQEINIPVLPSSLKVDSPGKNEKTTVLKTGEILLLQQKGLRTVSWDSFFPANSHPYVDGDIKEPISIVKDIQKARDAKEPIRFLITGTDLDCNIKMGIDSFDYEERWGELGDLYYTIKLVEWKDYAPRRIDLSPKGKPATAKEPPRPGKPASAGKTHTVVKGDCLWAIAKKFYGNGSRYPEIYAANKSIIDGRNKGTGNSKYTIYPGQVFKIP